MIAKMKSSVNYSLIFSMLLSLAVSSLAVEEKRAAQGEEIKLLKETVAGQKEQLTKLQTQIDFLKNQFENDLHVSSEVGNSNNVKRSVRSTQVDAYECSDGETIVIKGKDGKDGQDGLRGRPGPKGKEGPAGPAGRDGGGGGVVYVRWGSTSCPDTGAEMLYSGLAGGSHYRNSGGGGNPQCLPNDPEYLNKTIPGAQNNGHMYGSEYEGTHGLKAGSVNTDVACAVCYVPQRSTVYMLPAKYTCPKGWTREYFGYLMSEAFNHHRTTFSCVDFSFTPVADSQANWNGMLFYTIEAVCGAIQCPPYDRQKELSCAVCTK